MFKRKGQSTIEYTVLIMVIIGAFIAMSNYMKRGISGRWRSTVDDLGDQYDPRVSNTIINYSRVANEEMQIVAVNDTTLNGVWTNRVDRSDALETKTGDTIIGGY